MSNIVDSSLKTVAKGTAIVFAGNIIGLLLGFATKVLIVRYTTQAEFGIYSLAVALVSIFSLISTLGLQQGAARYISVLRGDEERTKAVAASALQIGIATGLASFLILYFSSEFISKRIFNISEFTKALRIVSLSIPFAVVVNIFISIFRGYGIIKPKVYFQDLGRPLIFLLSILILIALGLPFISILYAYVFSIAIVAISLLLLAYKKLDIHIFDIKAGNLKKELLSFSTPLLSVGLMWMIFNWTDTLMLGYFRGAEDVGLYNVGIALAKLLIFPLGALAFVFLPIAGDLYSKNLMPELKRTYQVLTKWVFSITLPVFLIFFLFPEVVLTFIFGERYAGAALILRILSLGFMFHTFMGANGMTLMVLGKSKILMWIALFGAVLNVLLNYSLIPLYGVVGAAIATTVSYFVFNIITSVKLYQHSGIHPITPKYFKPTFASFTIALVIYLAAKSIQTEFWMLPIFFSLFISAYILSLLITKSIEKEDFLMFEAIERKMGVDLAIIKNLISRKKSYK